MRTATILGLLLIPLTVLAAGLLMVTSLAGAERQREGLQRSYDTRLQIQRVFSLLQDAETGQRGFLITGRPNFLEPYTPAVEQLDAQLQVLDRLFRDEPAQRARMAVLRRQVAAKRATMVQGIELRRRDGAGAAADYVRAERGKRAMDAIRVTVAEMVAAESAQNAGELRLAAQRDQEVRLASALLGLLLIASLAGATLLLRRHGRSRERLLERLEQQTTRQQTIFDSTMDALVTLNPSGSIETCNRAAERMFGYERDELLRRDSATLVDFAPGEGVFLRRLALRGDPALGAPREFTARRKDGSQFPVEVSLGLMRLKDGAHVVAAIRDIQERKEAERLKDEFVSTVSHELRTPLTSIAGSLGLMEAGAAGQLPPKAARLVHIAKSSTDRLVRLINDLLDMQKIASGKVQLDSRRLDLRDQAAAAVEATSGFAQERRVTVRIETGADPVPARGDSDRLVQVIVNLLSNAIKFSPEGGAVDVTVSSSRGRAVVTVRDQGPGVPEAFQASLFRRFAQADGSAIRSVGGSGLGLAISREIAERHGGALRLTESSAQGAVFALELPSDAVEPTDAPAGVPVLVCEADPAAAATLCGALQAEGLACTVVDSAETLEAAVRARRYAAIFLGLQDQDEVVARLVQRRAEDPSGELPPVVVVSSATPQPLGGLAIADWIAAPVEPERLRLAVAAAVGSAERVHILHVDDDAELTAVVAAALEGCGAVEAAYTLAEAVAAVRRRRPDLIILDIALPDGSGLELLPHLGGAAKAPPVIVYSGQEVDRELAHRVDAVLTKSRVSFESLTATVRSLARAGEPTA